MKNRLTRINSIRLAALLLTVIAAFVSAACDDDNNRRDDGGGEFTLTIFHNNDGESKLVNAGDGIEDFGGVARFAARLEGLRAEAEAGEGKNVHITLNSGDNFLAGSEFNASLQKGAPYYDSIALNSIGYDAMAIGNHEFDFGPDVLEQFILGFDSPPHFVSANLVLTDEPGLNALAEAGIIVTRTVITKDRERIGVVGATTPALPFISSPRNVIVLDDISGIVQGEIDALLASGVNKIIFISHLQDVNEDLALAGELSGVDVMIAGGGDELLVNEGDLLVPGDEPENAFGPYPLIAAGGDGRQIPVVTTPGDYKYVGRLVVDFDAGGEVTAIGGESGLVRVAGGDNPDAVSPNPFIEENVVEPVAEYTGGLAANVIAVSEVALEGRREPGIRTEETNLGNLTADALFHQATVLAAEFDMPLPDVALQNGGGIRNNTLIPPGDITELTTFDIFPFTNFVSIVPAIPREQFKEIMENAVSAVENADGRFAQVSGFSMVYDPAGTPQVLDEELNVVTPGTRVRSITLDTGEVIVADGAVVPGEAIDIATIDFSARGGDMYPFRGAPFTTLGVVYQRALYNYIVDPVAEGGLGGVISSADYPEGGEGRITTAGD
ncbi:MAG: 5'-nucleotidase C-terminal domain-containing protein [Candidatus Dadabacteria bacterium]|nr:5'-nucleotidase C-terminal domain-containing protein [Candidatus Dadabacteria bacterium]